VLAAATTVLDFDALRRCLAELRGCKGRLPRVMGLRDAMKEEALWKPSSWASVVLHVANFLQILTTKFATLYEQRADDVVACAGMLEALLDNPDMVAVEEGEKKLATRAFTMLQR
jgi:hypothetical protein